MSGGTIAILVLIGLIGVLFLVGILEDAYEERQERRMRQDGDA
jgi:hypothetical protein